MICIGNTDKCYKLEHDSSLYFLNMSLIFNVLLFCLLFRFVPCLSPILPVSFTNIARVFGFSILNCHLGFLERLLMKINNSMSLINVRENRRNNEEWAVHTLRQRNSTKTKKLKSSFRKCYGRHHDLVDRYAISVSQMTTDMFHLS
jgi:hypothetical protein